MTDAASDTPPATENSSAGLDRLRAIFETARTENRGVLMPFIVGGSPLGCQLSDVLAGLERGGAGIVEIGFPFSDPIADGGVIAQSMHETLQAGRTVESLLQEVEATRPHTPLGLIAMVSVSLVERMGGAAFLETLSRVGFDGVIIPDITVEEATPYRDAATEQGLGFTLLVAPTTPTERAQRIAEACSGFVYVLARTGITGERAETPDVAGTVQRLRGVTSTPLAVGFGISSADHVRAVVAEADAAIVGSALVRRLNETQQPAAEAEAFCRSLSEGLSRHA